MGIWKEQSSGRSEAILEPRVPAAVNGDDEAPTAWTPNGSSRPKPEQRATESVIAADLAIEGKIEGSGHVRLVGRFKGDVHVEGDLTIEEGAKLTGSVRAATVVIAGELEGNIEAASNVELRTTGVLNGDLKAGSLTVASGSRMRGAADFGWGEERRRETRIPLETRSAS